jgi:hypothetical protein
VRAYFFRRRRPSKPARPAPNATIDAGSGTFVTIFNTRLPVYDEIEGGEDIAPSSVVSTSTDEVDACCQVAAAACTKHKAAEIIPAADVVILGNLIPEGIIESDFRIIRGRQT